MRQKPFIDPSIFPPTTFRHFLTPEIARELGDLSNWLDEHAELLELVTADLGDSKRKDIEGQCLSAQSVLRCGLLLKQYRQVSYGDLEYYLVDSIAVRSFARLRWPSRPSEAFLLETISAIRPETWEQIDRCLQLRTQSSAKSKTIRKSASKAPRSKR